MSNGHFCEVHNTAFFMKGRMKGYAHPIGKTGEWCNEDTEGQELANQEASIAEAANRPKTASTSSQMPVQPVPNGEMTNDMWAEKQRIERESIEAQVAYKGIVELLNTGVLKLDGLVGKWALAWGMGKLGANVEDIAILAKAEASHQKKE